MNVATAITLKIPSPLVLTFRGPPRPGLVPQSGDPEHPYRWVRPDRVGGVARPAASPINPPSAPVYIDIGAGLEEPKIKSGELRDLTRVIPNLTDPEAFFDKAFSLGPGFTTKLERMELIEAGDPTKDKSSAFLDMSLYDDSERFGSGAFVGRLKRNYHLEPDGTVTAEHELFDLEPAYQEKGLGSLMTDNTEAAYKEAGISRIKLHANLSIGGYVWARQGYDFVNESERQGVIEMLQINLEGYAGSGDIKGVDEDNFQDLSNELEKLDHPWEIAAWNPFNAEPGQHLGKLLLLGSDWQGVKSLDPNDTGYQVGEAYKRAKKGGARK